ncbi:MFS transporter [Streptomyces katrae]|uniref:Transporter n=1 Tax=Streptomyces katrae TaxID=68223 RepID=A0A0F4IUF9_9ACTN|nr:MFS transporter [Streptomyces katrae]KJY25642.1 transporter [Streptomyces katrae]
MSGTNTAGDRKSSLRQRITEASGGTNRWVVLAVLCVSLVLVALDATILHVAVPAVTEDLRPGSQELLWIVDAYPLVCAALLILFGTLGDRVGRRRILLLGYALFGAASAIAALADNAQVLIGARALLGVGGAMIMPATLSILRQVFPDRRERALAIGIWTAVAAIGAAGGPVLGGFLVQHFWWGSVFLINIPLMALILPLGRWLLPESRGAADGPWDVLGALTAAGGVLGVVLGVKRIGAERQLTDPRALVPLALGALLLVLFVRRQKRREHPLIDMRMFSRAAFSTSVGCIVLAMLALVGLELMAVQYLQLVLHLSPLETGLRLLPLTFAAMAAGATGSYTLQRVGPRTMVSLGFVLTAGAVLLLTLMGQHDRPALLTTGFVLLGFGLQTTLFAAYESMLSEAPVEAAGGAASIGAEDSAGAANSLGEAYQIAAHLGGPAGRSLAAAARHSFVHGLHVTLVVSAGLLLAGAVMALRLPRTMENAEPIACGAVTEGAVPAVADAGAAVRLPGQAKGPAAVPASGTRIPGPAVGSRPGRPA